MDHTLDPAEEERRVAAEREVIWPGMTRSSFDALKEYIAVLAEQLWLRDWILELETTPCDDDAHGSVSVTYGRRHASIAVAKDFVTLEPDEQRHIVVHELVHCHLDPIESTMKNSMPELIGRFAWAGVFEVLHRDIEMAVDTLTDAIAPHMPTCRWRGQ